MTKAALTVARRFIISYLLVNVVARAREPPDRSLAPRHHGGHDALAGEAAHIAG
jgi:hypothetical protein